MNTLGCNDFKDIEASAKKVKMGVWSDSKFEMPWDYRKRMVFVWFCVHLKYKSLIKFFQIKGIGFRGQLKIKTTKNSKINSRYWQDL